MSKEKGMEKWSPERIWDWYDKEPWIRGCNFIGSDCANRIDQWQELGFEERLRTADRELKLAADTGFNAVRLILEYPVWKEDHDGFMKRFERYLNTAYQYGIRAMITLGNDCLVPKDDPNSHPRLGKQHYDWGYHGGRKRSQHSTLNLEPGYSFLDDAAEAPQIYKWVGEIMQTYRLDDRVVVWDLYNEPGNGKRDHLTMPHLKKFYEIGREVSPMQPITSGAWRISGAPEQKLSAVEQFVLEQSDLVSYHNYGTYLDNIKIIKKLKESGRPIMCTEWLGRMLHNTVQEIFPLFFLEKIGCFNWGLVAGLYQTYEPWEALWEKYADGNGNNINFSVWFHDLYRPNLRPYDPHEIELIKQLCKMADQEI